MKRSRVIVLLLAIVAIGAITLAITLHEDRRLSYAGRSLRSWLNDYGNRPLGGGLTHDIFRHPTDGLQISGIKSATAIRAIGTNALPILLKELAQPDDPGWLKSFKALLAKINPLKRPLSDPQSRSEQAALALFDLGTNALPTLPELSRLLTNHPSAAAAAHALAGMGPAALPAYQSALANSNAWIQDCAVWGLAQIGPAARTATPLALPLLDRAGGPDVHLTAWAFGEIREPNNLVIPALLHTLDYPASGPRVAAATALAKFGPVMTNHLSLLKLKLEAESDKNVQEPLKELIRATEKFNQPADKNSSDPAPP